MNRKKTNKFKKFFENYSKNVDNASALYFWKLLDEIILSIVAQQIKPPLSEDKVILDAGGGTGRWIQVLHKIYKSRFILFDNSPEMLNIARVKPDLQNISNRLEIIEGDIQKMLNVPSGSIDYLISIYNPISFVEKPQLFFNEIQRVLKNKGIALVMGQGYYNAIASKINNYLVGAPELANLEKSNKVKWNSSLCPLYVFSKEFLEELARKAKLETVKSYGIPVFIQPGPGDFDSENKFKSKISLRLEKDKRFYEAIYNLEMKYNSYDTMVNRGMNLMIAVQKR